jgi:GxxExxY protein
MSGKGDPGDDGDMEICGYTSDRLTERVIQCIINVHQTLAPGFVERVYRRALLIELQKQNLNTEVEKEVVVYYHGQVVGRHRLDLLVDGQVILELKTVEALSKAHYAQVRSYLRATRLDVGLLVNFADDRADFRRVEAPVKYPREFPERHALSEEDG